MDPGQAESWSNLAVLYCRQNRLCEAIAAAKSGCMHCPHDAKLLLLHGDLLNKGGDAINAETCLLCVLEMDTIDAAGPQQRVMARQRLIALYEEQGRHREAEAHRRALAAESAPHSRIPAA